MNRFITQNKKHKKPKKHISDNPALVARKDISNYFKENNISTYDGEGTWIVVGDNLYNKEQRRLNAELGIHSINMIKPKTKKP